MDDPDATDPPDRNGAAEMTMARTTLAKARSALDLAVAALPDVDGDEAMATPALLLLLFGAVRAKEQVSRLEAQQTRPLARA